MPVFRRRKAFEIAQGLRAFLTLEVGLTRANAPDFEQRFEQNRIENETFGLSASLDGAAAVPASPSGQDKGTRSNDNSSAEGKLRVAGSRLEQGPNVEARTRLGGVRRFARRLALRGMRPFTSYQRQLDAAIIDALGALDTRLSEVVAGIELGTVPARETLYLGHPFMYPYDSWIGESIAHGNEWDARLRTVVAELLPGEEPIVCEVGSNIGASLLQILAAKPHARVVAFEPSTRFRPFLERNLELAGFDYVEILPLLVGRESGSMYLYKNNTTATTVSATTYYPAFEPRGKELVEMTTLDEVFRDLEPVDFIKVDTDGFDLEVLRGAEATLKRDRPILHFEVQPRLIELAPSAPVEGLAWLQGVEYRWFVCSNPAGRLVGTTHDPEQAIAWAEANDYCDVLVCPEGSASEARLEKVIEFD